MKYILFNLTLVLVIFYLINQFSGNMVIKKIKDLFYQEKTNDFYTSVNLPYGHSRKINDFLTSMIKKSPLNKDIKIKSKTFKANEKENSNIIDFLKRKFKSGSKEIKNIHIADRVLFNQSSSGYEFKPIIVVGEYYYNKKLLGVLKLQMELSFIVEKNGNLFINPNKFNKKCGTYIINRIFLIDFNNELKLKKNTSEISEEKQMISNSESKSTDIISSIMSEDLMNLSSDLNSSLLSFSSI